MNDLTGLSLNKTIEGLEKKQFNALDLNKAYLTRIAKINPKINAFLSTNPKSNKIPVAIKDLISVKGQPMTCGSKILENYYPQYEATVISNLYKHDISVVGKTNLDEFAFGSSGENSAYGPAKNPWNIEKITGGTSSGSAAAIASDLCVFALGTDTGGSIRQPGSLCGVVGLKPSYGRVSRYGAQAMTSSLDQIGPITKTIADARIVLSWIAGEDGFDSNVVNQNPISKSPKLQSLKNVKIGIPKEYFGRGLDNGVEGVIKKAIKRLESEGAYVIEINLPHTEYAIAAYYIIMASEASSNLARYDGIRFGKSRDFFGPEAKRRIILGTFALSSGYFEDYFIKAAKVRTLIKKDFEDAFKKVDVIAGPVSPTVAWNLGEKINDPLTMYLSDVYTIPASLAGIPGLSVPCGFSNGLPVGLQILGKYMDEATILDVAEIYEESTNWQKEKSKI